MSTNRLIKWSLIALPLIFILHGCYPPPSELEKKWPNWKSERTFGYMAAPVRRGYILTINNDTLFGYIRIFDCNEAGSQLNGVSILPFNKTLATDIITVKLPDIDYIKVEMPDGKDSAEYIIVHGVTWRIIGERKNVRICYEETWTTDIGGTAIDGNWTCLVKGKEIKMMPGNRFNPTLAFSLRRYINDSYGKHYAEKDFKSNKGMINYILDRESGEQGND